MSVLERCVLLEGCLYQRGVDIRGVLERCAYIIENTICVKKVDHFDDFQFHKFLVNVDCLGIYNVE